MMKKLLTTLQGKPQSVPPIWLMRQAGRYLPEYMEIRAKAGGFLDLVYNPKLATEVTLQPIRRYGFDAAILFSDILVVPHALGQDLSFAVNHGPVLGELPDLTKFNPDKFHDFLNPVYETVSLIRNGLNAEGFNDTALIGFSGAPWTLASYMLEGKGSKDFFKARCYALKNKIEFKNLIDVLVDAISIYCIKQIESGSEVIQLFDSWAGVLPHNQISEFVIKPTIKIVKNIKNIYPHIPIIGFPKGVGVMLPEYARLTGVDAVSLDASMPIGWAIENVPPNIVLQGNLDPFLLINGGNDMYAGIDNILEQSKSRAHIFNLGHGIDKETPPEHVTALINRIRQNR